jgi:hypothetical protein
MTAFARALRQSTTARALGAVAASASNVDNSEGFGS